ncbi:phage tail tape measure protein [Streptomyces sp. NPDC058642]|uniref:phage tail tape measure protein n=1 Tax=Streptomyces sp. NPDC058642 TaxID=3346572 RepID=UPI003669344C
MALTVGELNAILSVDERAMDPGLRRAEQALRASGQRMGDDADRAGREAGEDLGDGIVRGVDGRLRNARGQFISAGRRAGDAAGEGLTEGTEDGADEAVAQAEDRFSRLKAVAAGAGIAAGAALMAGFQEAMSQGQITGLLGAQLGATPAEAQRYGALAGQLFKQAIVADFQEGADTIAAVMNSGLLPPAATNAQITSLSTRIADLAKVLGMDVGEAANAAGVMVRNGLAKTGTEAIDMLVQASNQGANRFGDLGDSITQSANNLSHFGLTGQQAMGVMVQGIEAGAPSAELLSGALEEMAANAADGAETFDELGLNGKQMAKDFAEGGPAAGKALDTLMDRLRTMKDDAGRSKAMIGLFGEEALTMQDALLQVDPSTAAKALGDFGGAAGKVGDTLRDNAGTKLTAFKNSMQQNLVEFLGGQVIPRLSGFFTFVGENKSLFAGLTAGVLALGVAFSIASIGVWAMNSAMLANPIFWIIAGIAAGVAGLVLLIVTYWDEIKTATGAAWDWSVTKVDQAKDAIVASVMWLGQVPGLIGGYFTAAKDRAVTKATELVVWVNGWPGRIYAGIAGLASGLSERASTAWQNFRDAAVQKAAAFGIWVAGWPGRISKGIGSLNQLLYDKGVAVVQGLWSGIKSMGGWIMSQLTSWAKSVIPGPIAKALGIASPSKVTTAQGKWIAKGLVKGLTGSQKQVQGAADKLASIVRKSLSGKKERAALKKINKAGNSLSFLSGWDKKVAGQLKTAKKKVADLKKERDKLSADVKKGILDSADITKQETNGWPQTAETILAGLKQDTLAAQAFAKNLAALRKKGVRADLIAQIAQAGVEGGASAAAALANANGDQIKQINAQQGALVTAAGQAGATAGDAMYGAGIRAAQGLVRGLQSHQKYIDKTMLRIAKSMSASIRKALGIKSPSRVMALVGQYTAQGLIKGVEGQRSAVNQSMASLVETPAAGSWDMASSRARAAAANRTVIEIRSSGRQADDFVTESLRRSVRKKGGGDVDLVIAGRRSS